MKQYLKKLRKADGKVYVIKLTAEVTSGIASGISGGLSMSNDINKMKHLKETMNVSIPYCVYGKNPKVASDIDDKMVKLMNEADRWELLQCCRTAIWELTAGISAPTIIGPPIIALIQNRTEAKRMERKFNELSSRASLIKSEMLQATAKYCSREEVRKLARQMFGIPQNLPTPDAQFVLDPSGYVYEAVTSNRLEGVTATIYQKITTEDMYGDKHESIVKWDAEPYSQRNPVKTDVNGLYSWDVPDGLWQVKFEKDGYETVYSNWLPVPPPQLDINVPMYQSVQPEVTGAHGFESGVDFTFSKYMRPATFAEGSVTLSRDGCPITGQLKMLDIEKEPLDGVEYASHIKFIPDQSLHVGDEVTLTISHGVKSYCGVVMEKDYITTLIILPEIKEIAVNSVVNVSYGNTSEIAVAVVPADAAKGKILKLQNGTPSIIITDVTEFTLDANGMAKITVTGALPGSGALKLSVEDSDVSADVKVNVTLAAEGIAMPTASIASGTTVEKGTNVMLYCETEGATIYYTLDGSCPCDETTRLEYTGPIEINETVRIRAMAVAPDLTESDVVEFTYIVIDETDIDDVTVDENIKVYPLTVHDKLNVSAGGKTIRNVTLASMNGSIVMETSKRVTQLALDVSSLPSGIYIINIATEDKTFSRKIFKESK